MTAHNNSERTFIRLTRSERIQHVILFVSTGLLILTGFMLLGERWVIDSFGAAGKTIFYWRGIIHRVAAVAVTMVCSYHLYYTLFTADGRSWLHDMRPTLKDIVDPYRNVLYMIGLGRKRPKMDRFTYIEKLEYFSVYFGMFIVISTGIMMWTAELWPKSWLDIADAFHWGEATLAALAIIVGHIFAVHYDPHVYPMNRAFIDGKISEFLVREEHPLWYERIAGPEAPVAGGTGQHGERSGFMVHLVMGATFLLLFGFALWLVWITYFRSTFGTWSVASSPPVARSETAFEPFHGTGAAALAGNRSGSWCLGCHLDYSHAKSKEQRAFLNSHSFFMACEVCHVVPAEKEHFDYRWLARDTGIPLTELKGRPGDYGGAIVPFGKGNDGTVLRLDETGERDFAQAFVDRKVMLDVKRDKTALERIHVHLAAKPVGCDGCHRERGLLDFGKLLYPEQRAQRLRLGEGAHVVGQYKTFYMPSLSRETRRER
jgi:formate dehydrogenase subunit gamma